ncbi:MAG: hypothetical protein ACFCGT_07845 [Sandaracinaceae bacterium]
MARVTTRLRRASRRRLLVSAPLLLAGACADPPPPEPPEETPRAALDFFSPRLSGAMDDATELVRTRGFTPTGDERRGFLVEQTGSVHEVPMRSGSCDVVLAAASVGVRELDLALYDHDGTAVATDATDGRTAALRYCPSRSGTYYLALRATVGSGLFALRAFRGPTGLEVPTDDLFRALEEPAPPPPREAR